MAKQISYNCSNPDCRRATRTFENSSAELLKLCPQCYTVKVMNKAKIPEINSLAITGLNLQLVGNLASFKLVKYQDGVQLKIKTPERNVGIFMSNGQYDALNDAVNELKDNIRTQWFGYHE